MRHTRTKQRGALLGIVLILLGVIMVTSVLAFFGLRSDTGGAGQDRLARQLFDCAEQGLAVGKQYFTQPAVQATWGTYFGANMCSIFPCPPFPAGQTGAAPADYPNCASCTGTQGQGGTQAGQTGGANQQTCTCPFKKTVQLGQTNPVNLTYQIGVYNNPGEANPTTDTDGRIVVYSRCTDPATGQNRSVQALVQIPTAAVGDYFGQAGQGYNGQGNANNNF